VAVRAVFFDVFGTLMPYKVMPREIILAKRAKLAGIDLTPEQVKVALETLAERNQGFAMAGQLAGEDVPRDRTYWVATFSSLLACCGVEGDLPGYATTMCDVFLQTEDYYIDEETLPTLRGLKQQGFIVGIISNAPKGLAQTLDKYGILSEVALAIGSQDVGVEKPHPAIFQMALTQTGIPAAEAAYVGDEYMTDAKAAQKVGMMGIFLDRHNQRPLVDVPRIRRLTDLLAPDSPLQA
jgi:FMN phosphatase YigB (HAD superfamily)